MLIPLKRKDFDKYIDFVYALALDPARSGYPTYTDGIKTRADFVERSLRAFERENEDMYWNSDRLLADMDEWRLLLYMPGGVPAGALQAWKDSEMGEIFGMFFPAAYDSRAYRALVTADLNGAKADGAGSMVFFNDAETQADAWPWDSGAWGEYMCYKTAL